ncbi:class I SAM-dependent methyltransferase [Methylobacter sp. sgz302048]|uniref:class I SAM-dependent methyltransferase n=1 Tax=Methylobacter sp. sgz302048 TaxID=3455945 RepID=UPI003F9F74F2
MKILVSIANFGTKNVEYAKRLIQEYRAMPFDVDIFVLSEAPKDYGNDVKVLVGLPSKEPWSLPFGHKKLFADNVDKYDLFIYTEDDMLIRERNIHAFLKASDELGDNYLPGFIQYELYPDGKKNYPQAHGSYHWIPNSVRKSGDFIFAQFSNAHSACYILTQAQLRKALASGGFLVPPHCGRYDLLCCASTDPYTQCGFTRVVCLSHLQDFELHHLPNKYLGLCGLHEDKFKVQTEALLEILEQKRSAEKLFITEKRLDTLHWDKSYYESCRHDLLQFIPPGAQDILTVGCGWGEMEAHLKEKGKNVVAIPLDSVIAKLVENTGVTVTPADFEQAFGMLAERRFDAIVLPEILQHLPHPVAVLSRLKTLLNENGVLVGSVPNLSLSRRISGLLRGESKKYGQKFARLAGGFNETNLNLTSSAIVNEWLKASDLYPLDVSYKEFVSLGPLSMLVSSLPKGTVTRNIVFAANRRSN